MKKVFSYIFKDWKISDYIICALTFLFMIALLIVSKTVKVYDEIKEIFSTVNVVSSILLVWGTIFCSKKTIHGYAIGICVIAFFSYCLYDSALFGSFAIMMLAEVYLIFKLVLLCIKKEVNSVQFGLWDYVCLFIGLAICAYPAYMLMYASFSNSIVSETLAILVFIAYLFLAFKKNKFANVFALACAVLMTVSVVLLITQLELSNSALVIGLLMLVVYEIVECIKMLIRKKEIKQD